MRDDSPIYEGPREALRSVLEDWCHACDRECERCACNDTPRPDTVDAYAAIEALNWSTLKYVWTSPKLLQWRRDHPREDTRALALGRMIHVAVLEPEKWRTSYVVSPDWSEELGPKPKQPTKPGPNSRPATLTNWDAYLRDVAAWEAPRVEWECQHAFAEVVTAEHYALVERCAEAVLGHRVAAELLRGGRAEETVTWTDEEHGIACKMRGDFIRPTMFCDLKTTRHGDLRRINAAMGDLLYHGQLAWYHQGTRAARVLPHDSERPHVVWVQTTEPYDVVAMRMSGLDLDRGIDLTRALLRRYVECQAADWWPGIAPELVDSDLPRWAPSAEAGAEEVDW